jgi:two-component system, OmpR family, sensor histidine kinase VicK
LEFTRPSEKALEKTEALYGNEKILEKTLETFGWISEKLDGCLDKQEVSMHVIHKEIWNELVKLKNNKGIKIRILTEITEENLLNVEKFMEIAEIKHLDGVRSNFGLADGKEFLGHTISDVDQSISHAISSNVKGIVDAQQSLFEILWNAGIPADVRIKQIERHLPVEKTEILYGQENIVKHFLQDLQKVQERLDSCTDFLGPSAFVDTPIWSDYMNLKKRGVRLRFITEIIKDNVKYCEQLTKVCELRHLDKVKGNFGIIDGKEYGAASTAEEGQAPVQLVRSNVRAFVEQQQYFFETLWNKAVPAEHKLEQIQKGIEEDEYIETIKDPNKIQKLAFDLVKDSTREIMIIFSTSNALLRQVREGSFKLLEQVATKRGVRIRILTPSSKRIVDITKKYNENIHRIQIRYLKEDLQTKISLLLVDKRFSLAVELKDDSKETSVDAIGFSTYSNSKSTVLSYASIFETLWRQSELYQQLEALNEELRVRDNAQ